MNASRRSAWLGLAAAAALGCGRYGPPVRASQAAAREAAAQQPAPAMPAPAGAPAAPDREEEPEP